MLTDLILMKRFYLIIQSKFRASNPTASISIHTSAFSQFGPRCGFGLPRFSTRSNASEPLALFHRGRGPSTERLLPLTTESFRQTSSLVSWGEPLTTESRKYVYLLLSQIILINGCLITMKEVFNYSHTMFAFL